MRALGALVLVALGILLFFVTGEEPNLWTVFAAALAVLVGVAIVVAPWLVRLTRDLADERAARVREADRAEIAAHLHDSVLQTLALIQQKADPASEASRLARAQERELRDWLFAGSPGASVNLADELRRIAAVDRAGVRRAHRCRVRRAESRTRCPTLCSARPVKPCSTRPGTPVEPSRSTWSPRRRTSNSPSPTAVPGSTSTTSPTDRMGVRESILGRMRRIGGTAELRPGPGGTGTEVRLLLPLTDGAHHVDT